MQCRSIKEHHADRQQSKTQRRQICIIHTSMWKTIQEWNQNDQINKINTTACRKLPMTMIASRDALITAETCAHFMGNMKGLKMQGGKDEAVWVVATNYTVVAGKNGWQKASNGGWERQTDHLQSRPLSNDTASVWGKVTAHNERTGTIMLQERVCHPLGMGGEQGEVTKPY